MDDKRAMKHLFYFKNRGNNKRAESGFTITEIIISAAIISIVIIGVYTLYIGQQQSYINQQKILHLQQQMRVALNKVVKEIRMAGYDPQQTNETTANTFGLQAIDADNIYFTCDTDEDGILDSNEKFKFRVNSSKLEYSSDNGTTWQFLTWSSILANVEAVSLAFAYYDTNGIVAAAVTDVRIVDITLTEKVKLSAAGNIYHAKTLNSRVRIRNYD